VDATQIAEVAWPADAMPLAYICGSASFVEGGSRVLMVFVKIRGTICVDPLGLAALG
jgi:hypothetical protein